MLLFPSVKDVVSLNRGSRKARPASHWGFVLQRAMMLQERDTDVSARGSGMLRMRQMLVTYKQTRNVAQDFDIMCSSGYSLNYTHQTFLVDLV